jgi:hypothetical protein
MITANAKNLQGMRFGRLTAMYPTGEKRNKSIVWHCVCDCGNTVEATTRDLGRGAVKSCGCLKHQPPDPDNCIKNNLHFVDGTCIENLIASQHRPIKSSTGVRGVYRAPDRRRYIATIGFQGKNHYLGKFGTLQEASNARKKAEKDLFEKFLSEHISELSARNSGSKHGNKYT